MAAKSKAQAQGDNEVPLPPTANPTRRVVMGGMMTSARTLRGQEARLTLNTYPDPLTLEIIPLSGLEDADLEAGVHYLTGHRVQITVDVLD